jgi:GTP-binding protein
MAAEDRGWRVTGARFVISAPDVSACPPGAVPEVAFAGRSNVGKSSLLNALVGQRGLARTSRTPGRTQLLNVFDLDLHGPAKNATLRCVDLPGYGWVGTGGKRKREAFAPMIEGYISHRPNLRAVILLVDARRGLGDLDEQLLHFCTERKVPCLIVATKADKLGASERGLVRRKIAAAVGARPRDVLLTSATFRLGITGSDGLVADLAGMLEEPSDAAP